MFISRRYGHQRGYSNVYCSLCVSSRASVHLVFADCALLFLPLCFGDAKAGSLQCLQVHGCLSQAKVLLEINAQASNPGPLLTATLPALQSAAHLMHPGHPCAPIRNEATLLAAAVLALPAPPLTPAVATFAQQIRKHCWLAILQSCAGGQEGFTGAHTDDLASAVQGSAAASHGHHAWTQAKQADSHKRAARLQQRDDHTQANGMQFVPSDSADPMTSLWLKHVTLVFFGQDIQHALDSSLSSGDQDSMSSLKVEEVQLALQSCSYDVRAACLKALIKRSAAGMPHAHELLYRPKWECLCCSQVTTQTFPARFPALTLSPTVIASGLVQAVMAHAPSEQC